MFNWLREQFQNNSNASEAEMFYMLDEDRGQCCLYSGIDLEEQKSKTWIEAVSLVDEAEAKWKIKEEQIRDLLWDCYTDSGMGFSYYVSKLDEILGKIGACNDG